MKRNGRTIRIPAAVAMLVSFYLPLWKGGNFRALLTAGTPLTKILLALAAICSFLIIPVNVHGKDDRTQRRGSLILLVISACCMLTLMVGEKQIGLGCLGTIVYFAAVLALAAFSFIAAEEGEKDETAVKQKAAGDEYKKLAGKATGDGKEKPAGKAFADGQKKLNGKAVAEGQEKLAGKAAGDGREKHTGKAAGDGKEKLAGKAAGDGQEKLAGKAAAAGTLYVLCGELCGAGIPIRDSEPVFIGSDPASCSVVINGKGISRKHCMLTYSAKSGTYLLMDLSTNGTYLIFGGKRRRLPRNKATELRPGTLFYLALEKNTFSLG